jgi:hypothetical protein
VFACNGTCAGRSHKMFTSLPEAEELNRPPLGFHTDDRYRSVSEKRIVEMFLLEGWAYDRGVGSPGEALTREAIDRWIAMGLGVRQDATGGRYFDPVETLNFVKKAGLEGRDEFWTNRIVATARLLVSNMCKDDTRKFAVELRRTFNAQALPTGSALRLRMPLPLTSDHLSDLEVAPYTDAADARFAISRGRLEVRTQAYNQGEVTIGATISFTACPQEPTQERAEQLGVAPPDKALYLRSRDGLVVISDRVRALAAALAGPRTDPLSALHAFWNYCLDELCLGAVHYDQVSLEAPGDWVINSGWGDCQLIAALFASMCRARGIPARILGGFYLYRAKPTNHYWAEAWIDGQGWTPYDFACWELSAGGQDPAWRDHFFGRIDRRITNECLPLDFTGAVGVPIPRAWHILQSAKPDGVTIDLLDISATPLYSDFVAFAG